jgi:hypothetical protein
LLSKARDSALYESPASEVYQFDNGFALGAGIKQLLAIGAHVGGDFRDGCRLARLGEELAR